MPKDMRKFRIGDKIFHPDYPNMVRTVADLFSDKYLLNEPKGWVYLDYRYEDCYRLIDEMVIDRVLTKYNEQ